MSLFGASSKPCEIKLIPILCYVVSKNTGTWPNQMAEWQATEEGKSKRPCGAAFSRALFLSFAEESQALINWSLGFEFSTSTIANNEAQAILLAQRLES